ncbi:hypothetical protein [Bifidobacterium tissieri]|uniref:hypothetical protein n=1 Tax=Bifidobacterium tissieri TaxID=1630162 RepID=UPI00123AAE96|nr:hypothetical protein [Bifidobacterium tissieri]KAA8830166.1 hypothetical protein EM849_10330 [Bifidobacterium tissieri]
MAIDPKATPYELEALACDPDNWHLLDDIANHPSAWPELRAWALDAVTHPDTAGPPPLAPEEPKRGVLNRLFQRRRGAVSLGDTSGRDATESPAETMEDLNLGPVDANEFERGRSFPWRRAIIIATIVTFSVTAIGVAIAMVVLPGVDSSQPTATVAPTIDDDGEKQYRADEAARRLQIAVRDAEELLEDVSASPVAGAIDTSQLEQEITNEDVEAIVEETERLRKNLAQATLDETSRVGSSLADLVSQARELNGAPESGERSEMIALADFWDGRSVTTANLGQALQAEHRLGELIPMVREQRDRVEAEQLEHERTQAEKTTPTPQSRSTQPRRQTTKPSPKPQPPSWQAPGAGLPNQDGSL